MSIRYDKLWILMKDNKMKKQDLAKAAEISLGIKPYCAITSGLSQMRIE